MTRPSTVRLNAKDNVITACEELHAGAALAGEGLVLAAEIPRGHKIASVRIKAGEAIRKYDQVIGYASEDIAAGGHVHTHNCVMGAVSLDHAIASDIPETAFIPAAERATFQGFKRHNGKVGTRNYIGILSSVNCSATVCKFIAERFPKAELDLYPNVDGIVALTHSTGCGMADNGEGFSTLQRTLWGYARHPNFAGVLMIGLGCETNQIDFLLEAYQIQRGPLFRTLTLQREGGTERTLDKATSILREMLPYANEAKRETCPAAAISLALQCGGSDAYSGITANPALGLCADRLVREGGTAILAETPEIYGAEHLLTRRAVSKEVGDKLLAKIAWWEAYTARNGGEMNNNPSPGNKAGGLTTILEKSLGAAAKGGTTALTGVYAYAEPVTVPGFAFMDSPGYDPCSVTGQVASGATVVAFTTGRGSCFGFKPSPSLKIATNTTMYEHMVDDMDINAGAILDGEVTVEAMGERMFQAVLDLASGKPSKSEALGLGDHEFIPWQIGAVM